MEENNKIIAEFMGFIYEKNIGYYDNEMLLEQIVYEQQNGNCFDELLFNKDWNWLMTVVEKIESLNYTTDMQNIIGLGHYFRIYSAGADVITIRDYETKIKSVYKGCLEFIKWYNQNKQKEE